MLLTKLSLRDNYLIVTIFLQCRVPFPIVLFERLLFCGEMRRNVQTVNVAEISIYSTIEMDPLRISSLHYSLSLSCFETDE